MKLNHLTIILFSLIGIFVLQFSSIYVIGTDPYYHAQAGRLGLDLFSKHFPWASHSFFNQSFADKEFLFHILLIPFVWLGGLTGAKLATVLFATAAFGAFYFLCRKRNVPTPFLWVILLFAAADLFLYRISITRPHTVSLFLTLVLSHFLLENRKWWVAGLCTVFVLTYTAYHLVIGFAVLYCLNHYLHQRKWSGTLLQFAIFGTFLGILIHPHFPNNLLIWKVQNIDVLRLTWSSIDLGFGSEFLPPDPRWFLVNFTVAFFCLPICLFYSSWKRAEMKEDTTFFIFLAFGFFCLTCMSKRFAEYWPVYAILASACLLRDAEFKLSWRYIFNNPQKNENKAEFRKGLYITITILIISAIFFVRTYSKGLYLNSLEHEPYYKNAALWMKTNVPDKEIIFHSDWDEFPQLFYYNPENYYLVCLDPIFMYAHDPVLWLKWKTITSGESKNPDIEIKTLFNARFAFFSHEFGNAISKYKEHPKISVAYEDPYCTVFEIHNEPVKELSTSESTS